MCGICGVAGGDLNLERAAVEAMTTALRHRGPDDQGFYADPYVVLGHRRLTIIDLTSGAQPMATEGEELWITYNGELYNFRELRSELAARGHRFRTESDTEVVLHLYLEYGPRCVERMRGMFAFAIWDKRERSLFAARDRFGQKPFYYAVLGGRFLFASEIKGLLAHPDVAAEPEPLAVDSYLALRFVPPPLTMLKGVRKLAAGERLVWRNGDLRVESYWRLAFREGPSRPDGEWIAELGERVDEAVRSHLIADVPVGAYLSGGIDSSTVVASMARTLGPGVPTFAIGSDVATFDETPYARAVAKQYECAHEERFVSASQLRDIPRLVRCLDEPSDPIAACMYEASRLAAEHVKVVLGGDGGDEIFAGFDRYAAFTWIDRYASLPRWIRDGVVGPLLRKVPDTFAYKSLGQRARWLDALGRERGGRRYGRMTSFFRFDATQRRRAYGPWLELALGASDPESIIADAFDDSQSIHVLHRMLAADIQTRLPEHTLMLTDRLSMAHGLETRAPFLDHELAEFCASMPPSLKIRRGTTKYAMRRAARDRLPSSIIRRPKQGFMFPVAFWLNDETLPSLVDGLVQGPLVREGWIRGSAIEGLAREHKRRVQDHHVRIWMLLNLDAWFRIYLDGSAVETIQDSKYPAPAGTS